MSTRRKSYILFTLCLTVFFLHQFVQKIAKVKIALLDSYLDPLLAMPVLLHLITIERRILTKNPKYKLPLFYIILYVVIVSVLAEMVFPIFTPKLISDPFDVVLYAIGASFYALTQRPLKTGIPEFRN